MKTTRVNLFINCYRSENERHDVELKQLLATSKLLEELGIKQKIKKQAFILTNFKKKRETR